MSAHRRCRVRGTRRAELQLLPLEAPEAGEEGLVRRDHGPHSTERGERVGEGEAAAGHQIGAENGSAARHALEAVDQNTALGRLDGLVDEEEAVLENEREVRGCIVSDRDPQIGKVLRKPEAAQGREAEDVADLVSLEGGQVISRSDRADG
jgi:hypothetical protein